MNLSGSGAVVTGGGNGIGRALARRLAAGGARVVVNDLDAAAATAVADEIGGSAVPADVSTEEGVLALVATAGEYLGEIDVYCSNAGIAAGTAVDGTDETWQRSWEVNVMAHVRAARQLLPGWLDRRSGRMVITASAAGLLTMLGTAPYSVTKHAAVGYAEWLAVTYGHRGRVGGHGGRQVPDPAASGGGRLLRAAGREHGQMAAWHEPAAAAHR